MGNSVQAWGMMHRPDGVVGFEFLFPFTCSRTMEFILPGVRSTGAPRSHTSSFRLLSCFQETSPRRNH